MTSWDAREATAEARLARALGYPYHLPISSYVLETDGSHRAAHPDEAPDYRKSRTPVLAVGSNQSPEQLARKFPGGNGLPILCERCTLDHFDTVYSAHISAYGSIAAALHPSPGTRVTLFVNWLDDAQLARMHETEIAQGNYAYARLTGIDLATEFGHALDSIAFYVGNRGALLVDGAPVPLAAVPATGRRWPAATQREVQASALALTDPGHSLEEFVHASVTEPETRRRRMEVLARAAAPFEHPGLIILKT